MKYIKTQDTALIPIGTLTRATRGQRILAEKGMKSFIEKNTDTKGCQYSLRVDNLDYPSAMAILLRASPRGR